MKTQPVAHVNPQSKLNHPSPNISRADSPQDPSNDGQDSALSVRDLWVPESDSQELEDLVALAQPPEGPKPRPHEAGPGLGPVQSVDDGKSFMLNQVEGTFNHAQYTAKDNLLRTLMGDKQAQPPEGYAPDGPGNCGPTSTVMALEVLHIIKPVPPDQAEKSIEEMRQLEHPGSTHSEGSWGEDLIRGINAKGGYGRKYSSWEVNRANIDAALMRGNVIILSGVPKNAWASQIPQKDYLADHNAVFAHYVLIAGKAADGNYIVMDPLNMRGAMEVSPQQLDTFMNARDPMSIDMVEVSNRPFGDSQQGVDSFHPDAAAGAAP